MTTSEALSTSSIVVSPGQAASVPNSARRAVDRPVRREDDLVNGKAGGLEHPAPHFGLECVGRHRPTGLDDHNRPVWMSRGDRRERSDTARTDARHPVHDALDVLREIIATADDDHFLSAAADEELSVR